MTTTTHTPWRALFVLLLGLLGCSACSDDDGPAFLFDNQGECYAASVNALSKEDFARQVVGFGWKHVSTYEINTGGNPSGKEYYTGLVGVTPSTYYFESNHALKEYLYVDALPARGFRTRTYAFEEGSNKILSETQIAPRQIVSLKGDVMKLIVYIGLQSTGGGTYRHIYGYATYHRMTDKELTACQEQYTIDFDQPTQE